MNHLNQTCSIDVALSKQVEHNNHVFNFYY